MMRRRGQSKKIEFGWARMPAPAARFFDTLTSGGANERQVREIADDLLERIPRGRLLEIGSGPGRLLVEMARRAPQHLELHGLDLSPQMIEIARQHLGDLPAELRVGSIERTDYDGGTFDLVTCTGSFYIWHDPIRCLEEIHRLLVPGGAAVLFELHRSGRPLDFLRGVRDIFWEQGLLRGALAPVFLAQAIRMSRSLAEVSAIIRQTNFAEDFRIEPVTLAALPIWVRIVLEKKVPSGLLPEGTS